METVKAADLTEQRGVPAGNMATSMLKLLALLFMFCDHAGKMLLPTVPEMRMLGRLAMPLYAWCLVVGFHYTRSPLKYLGRMAVIGLISQPLYMVALNHTWKEPNIFLTLCLGLCAIWGIREKRWLSHLWAPAAALVLAVLLSVDYGWKGVLFIIMLYLCRDSRTAIACMMIGFSLFWGSTSRTVSTVLGMTIQLSGNKLLNSLLSPWLKLQALMILSLPLILWRSRIRWRMNKYLGYAIYPLHLLVLWGLECLVNK